MKRSYSNKFIVDVTLSLEKIQLARMKGKKNKQNNTEIKNSKYKNNATNRKVCRDQYGSVHA